MIFPSISIILVIENFVFSNNQDEGLIDGSTLGESGQWTYGVLNSGKELKLISNINLDEPIGDFINILLEKILVEASNQIK